MTTKQAVSIRSMLVMFLLLFLACQSLRADVRAQLSRSTIYDGDTVTLVIESTDRDQGEQPDLSVLEQDFEVLGTSSSQQVQIINGRRTDKHQWQVELDPRRTGSISIPPVRVGSDETRPLTLEVQAQPAAEVAGADQPVFVRTSMEPEDGSVFVQQQIQFSVQLYYRVALSEGSFVGPDVAHAVIEQLGEDTRYRTTLDGQQYQVVERRYAIFPEQSGALTIPAVTFTGRVRSAGSSRSPFLGMDEMMDRFFSSGGRGQRVRVRSEPLSITVKPRPDNYTGKTWLPSERFVLRDSWTQGPPEFRVGEPVTRTIEILARGLAASQLPEIDIHPPAGMRLYPEAPLRENRTDGDAVFGSSTQSIAYVPSAAGKISIPEVRVDWWDVNTRKQQTAVLPAWEFNVTGDAGAVTSPPPASPATALPPAVTSPDEPAPGGDDVETADSGSRNTMLSGFVAGVLLLAVLLLLYRYRSRSRTVPATPAAAEPSRPQRVSATVDALQQACTSNDADAAAKALLQWAAAHWPEQPPTSLGALAQRISSGGDVVRELDQVLYAAGSQAWQGQALWEAFQQGMDGKTGHAQPDSDSLSPLYPDWKKTQNGRKYS